MISTFLASCNLNVYDGNMRNKYAHTIWESFLISSNNNFECKYATLTQLITWRWIQLPLCVYSIVGFSPIMADDFGRETRCAIKNTLLRDDGGKLFYKHGVNKSAHLLYANYSLASKMVLGKNNSTLGCQEGFSFLSTKKQFVVWTYKRILDAQTKNRISSFEWFLELTKLFRELVL